MRGGTRDGLTPQGLTGTWVQAEGGKGGSALSHEMATDAGMRSGENGRVVEAWGWWVQETSRWVALYTGIGGGEQMKNERGLTITGYIW